MIALYLIISPRFSAICMCVRGCCARQPLYNLTYFYTISLPFSLVWYSALSARFIREDNSLPSSWQSTAPALTLTCALASSSLYTARISLTRSSSLIRSSFSVTSLIRRQNSSPPKRETIS